MSKIGIFFKPIIKNKNYEMVVFEVELHDQWIPIIFDYDRDKYNLEGSLRREGDMKQLNQAVATVTNYYKKKRY